MHSFGMMNQSNLSSSHTPAIVQTLEKLIIKIVLKRKICFPMTKIIYFFALVWLVSWLVASLIRTIQ